MAENRRFLIKVDTQMTSQKLAHLMDMKKKSRLAMGYLLGLPMLGLLLSGCTTVGPTHQQPALPMLSSNYQTRDSQLQPAQDLESWWQSFADPTLNQLVSRSLANNLTVQIAVERIVEAQANASLQGEKSSPHAILNCKMDPFGRTERVQQVAQAELMAQEYSFQEAQQTLIADVATSYLTIRLLQNQIEIVENSLLLQQETTISLEGRAKAGVVTKLDAEQTVAFLHRTRAEKAALNRQLDTEFNRLSILLGESPSPALRDLVGFGQSQDAPYLPMAGIPADLIRRRPDIRQAEAEVVAATARIGIAEADLYPSFNLLGELSVKSRDTASLFQTNSPASVAPFVRLCMKHSGRINDNIEIHYSRLRQAVGHYRVAVLNAVKEVEDSMAMYDGFQKQSAELQIALQSDAKAVELSLQRYEMGKSNFQRVIDVQMQMLKDSQASAAVRAKANIQLIKLYKAVGGGWALQSVNTSSSSCGCAECAAGNPEGGGDCWSSNHSQQQTEYHDDYNMSQAPHPSQFQNPQSSETTVFETNLMQPAGSQNFSPPQPNNHSILQTDDYGPIEFTPNLGQTRQVPTGSTEKEVLSEMFDWNESDAAVVKSTLQKYSPVSPVATAGYFTESPRVNDKQNTQKASSIESAPMVWDSEAIKVD